MLTHKSQSPPLQPNYFTIFSSPRNSNLYQVCLPMYLYPPTLGPSNPGASNPEPSKHGTPHRRWRVPWFKGCVEVGWKIGGLRGWRVPTLEGFQAWSVLRLDRFPGWMVPRHSKAWQVSRFEGSKVGGRQGWRVANSESSRVAGNPPRVGGFQGWIVSRLDSWKTPGGFKGWSWRSKVEICWNVPRFPRLKGSRVGGFQGVRVGVLGSGGFHGSSC